MYQHQGDPQFGNPMPRRGLPVIAIVAIVLGGCVVVGLGIVAILAAVMFPVFAKARNAARLTSCRSNVKQLSTALLMYAQDYDERLPPAGAWESGAMPYYKNPRVNVCPSDSLGAESYAFNAALSGRNTGKIRSAASAPQLFESSLHTYNGNDLLKSWDPRHPSSPNPLGVVGYVDGHVTAMWKQPNAGDGLGSGGMKGR